MEPSVDRWGWRNKETRAFTVSPSRRGRRQMEEQQEEEEQEEQEEEEQEQEEARRKMSFDVFLFGDEVTSQFPSSLSLGLYSTAV